MTPLQHTCGMLSGSHADAALIAVPEGRISHSARPTPLCPGTCTTGMAGSPATGLTSLQPAPGPERLESCGVQDAG
jgi:hypothetical protein